jgi:SAM-dependent methyltransferase
VLTGQRLVTPSPPFVGGRSVEGVAAETERARSFGAVAAEYAEHRPGYPAAAVEWALAAAPGSDVLDLGAGTGKLTRQLVPLAGSVVAVEPDPDMRAVLQRVVPGVEALDGSAEAMPLPDESVDAITAAQAAHWFRIDEAMQEMHRVLRPGGGAALLWNEWDPEDELLRAFDTLIEPLRANLGETPDWRGSLEATPLFERRELRRFRHTETLEPERVVERVASVSVVAYAAPAEREQVLSEVARLSGSKPVAFPMITSVGVADRVS